MRYRECLIKDCRKFKYFVIYGEIEEITEDSVIISDTTGKIKIKVKDLSGLNVGDKVRVFGHWENDMVIADIVQKMKLGVYLYNKYQKLVEKLFKEEEE